MKADLAAKLVNVMRGEVTRKYPVTRVTRVTGVECNTSKPLMLHRYTCNPSKSASLETDATERVTRDVMAPPPPDRSPAEDTGAALEERKAMAMGGVPEPYLDAWARLQVQKPEGVSDAVWRQAIDDAGRFLDQWGSLAIELGWTAGELFDVPRDGNSGGLVWFQKGGRVRSLGPEHAVLADHVLIPCKPPKHGLPQHSDESMPAVPASACVGEYIAGNCSEAERIVEFPVREQAAGGRNRLRTSPIDSPPGSP